VGIQIMAGGRPLILVAAIALFVVTVYATIHRNVPWNCEADLQSAFRVLTYTFSNRNFLAIVSNEVDEQEIRQGSLTLMDKQKIYFRTLQHLSNRKCREEIAQNDKLRGSLSLMMRALAISAGLSYAQRNAFLTVHIRNFPSVLHSPLRMYLSMGDVIIDRSAELIQELQAPRSSRSWRARLLDEVEWWRRELTHVVVGSKRLPSHKLHSEDNRTEEYDRDTVEDPVPQDLK